MYLYKHTANLTLRVIALIFIVVQSNSLCAQDQDTSLVPETLDKEDLTKFKKQKGKYKFSLDALNTDHKDIIQNYYVVTKYDIFQYDCITLVDVLKIVPGFRVSQPGNAQLGEMFAVNGLVGNVNMTVMINGLPINPSGLPGIPVGAQLPIKQAERIEIIIGPSIMFGTVSGAGVINIVVVEVERPVEVNASVSIGDNGLRSINTLMSGKTGKGKNLLSYSLYGSFTNRDYVPKDLDTSQFRVSDEIADNPNFISNPIDRNIPIITDLPSSGTLIGANIRYRGFTVTAALMTRKAHAAIGASPNKISYSNRSTLISESNNIFGIDYKTDLFKHMTLDIKGSFLFYETDENSSYLGVDHPISNGINYLHFRSLDFNFTPTITYKKNNLSLIYGSQSLLAFVKNQNFMQAPYNPNFYEIDETGSFLIQNSTDSLSSITAFTSEIDQLFVRTSRFAKARYQTKKITALVGLQYETTRDLPSLLNFNLALSYNFSEKLNLRGVYTQLSQYPNSYFQINNYVGTSEPNSPSSVIYEQEFVTLEPEQIDRIELTLNYYLSERTRLTARVFQQVLTNGLTNLIDEPNNPFGPVDDGFFIGYTNNKGRSILNGLQLSAFNRGEGTNSTLDIFFRFGSEDIDNIARIESYRNVPGFSLYYTLSSDYKGSNNQTGISFRYESAFTDHVSWVSGEPYLPKTIRSFNFDWSHNIAFGKNLYLKLKILNLFKTRNHGIYYNLFNTNTFDYAPQIERIFSFGLKYRLN